MVSPAHIGELIHELNEIIHDILGEQYLDFIEGEIVIEQHIPANGSSSPVDLPQPLRGLYRHLVRDQTHILTHYIRYLELDLHLPTITVGQDLTQDHVALLLVLLRVRHVGYRFLDYR